MSCWTKDGKHWKTKVKAANSGWTCKSIHFYCSHNNNAFSESFFPLEISWSEITVLRPLVLIWSHTLQPMRPTFLNSTAKIKMWSGYVKKLQHPTSERLAMIWPSRCLPGQKPESATRPMMIWHLWNVSKTLAVAERILPLERNMLHAKHDREPNQC